MKRLILAVSSFAIILVLLLAATPVVLAAPAAQDNTTHVVKRGETLSAIAQQYGVCQQAIMDANGIADPSLILVGQRLVIPGSTGGESEAGDGLHVVKRGETLSAIAQRYGVSVTRLAEVNGIDDPSRIRTGQRLVVPGGGQTESATAAPETTASAPANNSNTVHTVKAGESLTQIAGQYDTTVAAIASVNGIDDPSRIATGQRLTIPDGSSPPAAQAAPQGSLSVVVSISQQRCWVYRGDQVIHNWRCSTGRPGYGTKTGTFYVQSKIRAAWGSTWGFYMPYWLGIYWAGSTENGIHGLPYEPGGYPVWANAVGTPVTFGCVLLGAQESKTLWDMAYIGMPVTIKP